MNKHISAADANRQFSHILRQVREGESFVVTSHGRPVAEIRPVDGASSPDQREAARKRLFARLDSQPVVNIGQWSRDELYED